MKIVMADDIVLYQLLHVNRVCLHYAAFSQLL